MDKDMNISPKTVVWIPGKMWVEPYISDILLVANWAGRKAGTNHRRPSWHLDLPLKAGHPANTW